MESMTVFQLLLRSVRYYWRTELAAALGVTTAAAVITGALLVGDSVRDSLRQMSLDRLGEVDLAVQSRRYFRAELADRLAAAGADLHLGAVAPAIVMPGALTRQTAADSAHSPERTARAGGIQVYGVEDRFWSLTRASSQVGLSSPPTGNQVVLNRRTADQLGARVGDEVSLTLEIPASIPRDALLGDRDQTATELLLEVAAIAEDASTLGRFGLNPSQQLPRNAFVSLETLQRQLGLAEVRATRRTPTPRPARVNALFLSAAASSARGAAADAPDWAAQVSERLHREITLADLGLRLVPHSDRGYLSLESDQMILENALADAALQAAQSLEATTSPVLVYLLNRMGTPEPNAEGAKRGYSMYSVAAGVQFDAPPPFGPFEFLAGGPPGSLEPGDRSDRPEPPSPSPGSDSLEPPASPSPGRIVPVVVNEWLADDLAGEGGDGTRLDVGAIFPVRYHVVGDRGELPEEELEFEVTGIVRLAGPADDRGLTPQVEGVTDVESYSDWREPFPLDHKAITPRDDAYWKAHRATPKVFLRLEDAQRLWQSRYGRLTSLRLAPPVGSSLDHLGERFPAALMERLSPQDTALLVQPVKYQGLQAAAGTTDFTGLFLGFSIFLIASALLLIGLLFRLGIEQRVGEVGLLAAVGMTSDRVRRLFLGEGLLVSLLGVLLGLPAAIGYAAVMIYGLKTWWNRAVGTQFLFLSTPPQSLVMGSAASLIVAAGTIVWALRRTRAVSTRDLLQGVSEPPHSTSRSRRGRLTARRVSRGALGTALGVLACSLLGLVPGGEAFGGLSWQVAAFFVTGMALLVGMLAGLASWLGGDQTLAVEGAGTPALLRLALRNAARNRARSLLTASLIASAVFVIVAVACGKRNPEQEAPRRDSGNGGFSLVAESSQPILYDLNSPAGRGKLRLPDSPLWSRTHVAPLRVRPGEDASCLNLYQTQLPTILGLPRDVLEEFDRSGRFRFADTPSSHPWRLLTTPREDGRIPVLGDMNTLMFSLKKGIGDGIEIPPAALAGSSVPQAQLVVAGMLDGSVFQGVLLMSEEHFQRLFPQIAGFRYFLIETDPAIAAEVSSLLESGLADAGFDAEPAAARLADFLAVQNTYLSTFQTLGGLGLLLGTIGLAAVMLRNVLERRSELALLRAVGWTNGSILQLVFWENAALLGWGLGVGTLTALLSMWPHLASTGADVPWGELLALLTAVLLIGMAAPLAAGREVLRPQILAALRSE